MGVRTWGECARSGRRVRLDELVRDGQNTSILVAADEYDPYHPQLRLSPKKDLRMESVVRNPSPWRYEMVAPDLSIDMSETGFINLAWTVAESQGLMRRYTLYRSVQTSGGVAARVEPTEFADYDIVRDWDAAILSQVLSFREAYDPAYVYRYFVYGLDWDAHVIRSNEVESGCTTAIAPVLAVDSLQDPPGTYVSNTATWTQAPMVGTDVTAYVLQKAVFSDGVWGAYATVYTGLALSYVDTAVVINTQYRYRVQAQTTCANTYSNVVTATESDTVDGAVEYWGASLIKRRAVTGIGIPRTVDGAWASAGQAAPPSGQPNFKVMIATEVGSPNPPYAFTVAGLDTVGGALSETITFAEFDQLKYSTAYFSRVDTVTAVGADVSDKFYTVGSIRRTATGTSGSDVKTKYEAIYATRTVNAGATLATAGYDPSPPAGAEYMADVLGATVATSAAINANPSFENVTVTFTAPTADWTVQYFTGTFAAFESMSRLASPTGAGISLGAGWRKTQAAETVV